MSLPLTKADGQCRQGPKGADVWQALIASSPPLPPPPGKAMDQPQQAQPSSGLLGKALAVHGGGYRAALVKELPGAG